MASLGGQASVQARMRVNGPFTRMGCICLWLRASISRLFSNHRNAAKSHFFQLLGNQEVRISIRVPIFLQSTLVGDTSPKKEKVKGRYWGTWPCKGTNICLRVCVKRDTEIPRVLVTEIPCAASPETRPWPSSGRRSSAAAPWSPWRGGS